MTQNTQNIKHTISIFKKIYKDLPPSVPDSIRDDMKEALGQIENNQHLDRGEIEDVLVEFGKKTWPYRKAFHEFVDVYEGKMGEKILLSKMPKAFKMRYKEFKEHGYSFRDLYSGNQANFFTVEERVKLHKALVETRNDVKKHVKQLVVSSEKKEYQKKIKEFKEMLDKIEENVTTLKELAQNEQEHPEIVSEIKEKIRSFEHSLCGLGPDIDHLEVSNSKDFFQGRKKEKNNFIFAD